MQSAWLIMHVYNIVSIYKPFFLLKTLVKIRQGAISRIGCGRESDASCLSHVPIWPSPAGRKHSFVSQP
jgi:hypothetical protein